MESVFRLRPSWWLLVFYLLVHVAMSFVMLMASVWWLLTLVFMIALWAHFIYVGRRYALLKFKKSVVLMAREESRLWSLVSHDSEKNYGYLLADSVVTNFMIILNFKVEKRRRSVIVLPDMLSKDSFRRLRVFLKFH